MRPVDRLVIAYLTFATVLILVRWEFSSPENWLLLAMHALIGVLVYLVTRVGERDVAGRVLHDIYPLLLLPTLYTELGILTMQRYQR